jgi:hypothetical protein
MKRTLFGLLLFLNPIFVGADPGVIDVQAVSVDCSSATPICADHVTRRVCDGVRGWKEEVCPEGTGCLNGECAVGFCSDACNLGEVDGSRSCELFDIGSASWLSVDPKASMHDRARAYNQWLRRDNLPYGGVGNAIYADAPTYSDVAAYMGHGDSAIWTGTYLAAEALRLKSTGSADARANVSYLVSTLHRWFNISGAPGILVRYAAPSDRPSKPINYDLNCIDESVQCVVSFEGGTYDYNGHVSRDQYQGVMLGYALAYEALSSNDEAIRQLIREDVVELVEELMKERSVPFEVNYKGTTLTRFTAKTRFTLLNSVEMTDGAVKISFDGSDVINDSDMRGLREFIPDLGQLLRQVPGLSWVPVIPRAGSALMLASFFQVALKVTEGVSAYAERRDAIENFYRNNSDDWGNVADWMTIAKSWAYTQECGEKYYGNNIVMEPMYNLARLEKDPSILATVRDNILEGVLWKEHQGTKNSFFYYIYSSNVPSASAEIAEEATSQLSGFPPPPRVHVQTDLLNDPRYLPHEQGCENQTSHDKAVDVADRMVSDFIWQRHPWGLYQGENASLVYPGVDYLVAYWMGRHHGYIVDDKPGTCLAWQGTYTHNE